MAQAGEIPAFNIRGQWRISRTEPDRWMNPACGTGGMLAEAQIREIEVTRNAP
jgi:hypothetical protein